MRVRVNSLTNSKSDSPVGGGSPISRQSCTPRTPGGLLGRLGDRVGGIVSLPYALRVGPGREVVRHVRSSTGPQHCET
jgi:hypothetical protein